MGRSRKKTDKLNKVKRARNAVKELVRLKKTLGLIDEKGNEIIKKVEDITTVTNSDNIKKKKREKLLDELPEEKIKIVNDNTKVVHVHSTKTLKDQFGNVPAWAENERKKNKFRKRKLDPNKKKSRRRNTLWFNKTPNIELFEND